MNEPDNVLAKHSFILYYFYLFGGAVQVEVRGRPGGTGFPSGSCGSNSGVQDWRQAPLPTAPAGRPSANYCQSVMQRE